MTTTTRRRGLVVRRGLVFESGKRDGEKKKDMSFARGGAQGPDSCWMMGRESHCDKQATRC